MELNALYIELDEVERMTEAEVMTAYNADSKDEIIELIRQEIESLCKTSRQNYTNEHHAPDCDRTDEELEQERTDLCCSQGLSRYC